MVDYTFSEKESSDINVSMTISYKKAQSEVVAFFEQWHYWKTVALHPPNTRRINASDHTITARESIFLHPLLGTAIRQLMLRSLMPPSHLVAILHWRLQKATKDDVLSFKQSTLLLLVLLRYDVSPAHPIAMDRPNLKAWQVPRRKEMDIQPRRSR